MRNAPGVNNYRVPCQPPIGRSDIFVRDVADLLTEAMELAARQQAQLPKDGQMAADFTDLQGRYFQLIEKTDA